MNSKIKIHNTGFGDISLNKFLCPLFDKCPGYPSGNCFDDGCFLDGYDLENNDVMSEHIEGIRKELERVING